MEREKEMMDILSASEKELSVLEKELEMMMAMVRARRKMMAARKLTENLPGMKKQGCEKAKTHARMMELFEEGKLSPKEIAKETGYSKSRVYSMRSEWKKVKEDEAE